MTEEYTGGPDTWVGSAAPTRPHPSAQRLKLQSGSAKALAHTGLDEVVGRGVVTAYLKVPVDGVSPAMNITVTPLDGKWDPATATWDNDPPTRAGAVTAAQAALTDGQEISVPISSLVQAVSTGAVEHYGFQLTTSSGTAVRLKGNDHPDGGIRIVVEYADAPEPPSSIRPAGGVVGAAKPVFGYDFFDFGGDSVTLGEHRWLINAGAPDAVSPDFDSGWLPAPAPIFDSAAWAGVAPLTEVFVAGEVKDTAGVPSGLSDWVSYVYKPKPGVTLINPAAGVVWDPTPTFAAELTDPTVEITGFRLFIYEGTAADRGEEVYDSTKKAGQGTHIVSFTPEPQVRLRGGRRTLLRGDGPFVGVWRFFTDEGRVASIGDPAYIEKVFEFVVDEDATPPPPTDLVVEQIGDSPYLRFTLFRESGWAEGVIFGERDDDGVDTTLDRLDPDDDADELEISEDGRILSWTYRKAAPMRPYTFWARAIDGGKQTVKSPEQAITPVATGVWLLAKDARVVFKGLDVGGFRNREKKVTYETLYGPDIDVVLWLGGTEGTFTGWFTANTYEEWKAVDRKLTAMRRRQAEQVVQLVYGTRSVPVMLSGMSWDPAPEILPTNHRTEVTFTAKQVDDFTGQAL